jgi:hypothetical protein
MFKEIPMTAQDGGKAIAVFSELKGELRGVVNGSIGSDDCGL